MTLSFDKELPKAMARLLFLIMLLLCSATAVSAQTSVAANNASATATPGAAVRRADEHYRIGPGDAYAPQHDRHTIRVLEPLRLVCVFDPALTGHETHDADGSYEPATGD